MSGVEAGYIIFAPEPPHEDGKILAYSVRGVLRAIWLVFSLLRRGLGLGGVVFQKFGWWSEKLHQNPHPVLSSLVDGAVAQRGGVPKRCTRTLTIYSVVRGLVGGPAARWGGVQKSCTRTPTLYTTPV